MSERKKVAKKNNLKSRNADDDNRIIFKENHDTSVIINFYHNKFRPVSSYESTILTISSFLFIIPGYYAYRSELYFYCFVSVITSLVSANHWRHVMEGWRRTADLITAKVSFAIYFISGCIFFCKNLYMWYIGFPGCLMIIGCYFLSNHFRKIDSAWWLYFHMFFHVFVAFEQYLVLYSGVLIDAKEVFR